MNFVSVATSAASLFAGVAALGQPIPLMLVAFMALACVSAEAATPVSNEPFPVAPTAAPLYTTIPAIVGNVSQTLVRFGGGREDVLWEVGRHACIAGGVFVYVCPMRSFVGGLG